MIAFLRPRVIENHVIETGSDQKKKILALHPTLYLHTGHWNSLITSTPMRNFALFKQFLPVLQERYRQFQLPKTLNNRTDHDVWCSENEYKLQFSFHNNSLWSVRVWKFIKARKYSWFCYCINLVTISMMLEAFTSIFFLSVSSSGIIDSVTCSLTLHISKNILLSLFHFDIFLFSTSSRIRIELSSSLLLRGRRLRWSSG